MALTNIFSIKKPKYDTKSPIQGAAAKIGQAASYAPPNYAASVVKNTASAGVGAASKFLNRFSQPQQGGMSKAPQMSVAPKPQIQGSGVGSQYASNPSNYQAPVVKTPTTAPAAPTSNANTSWMNYVQNAADRQRKMAEEQQTQKSQFIKDKYQLANQQLQEALPAAQQQFGNFKANTEATIADLLASGARQKSQAEDYQGEAQRRAAQTLRETQGQTARTFANLGTTDSRGEGSYSQANENQMSEFNRFTQQGLKALADKKSEIDATVGQAERDARSTIMQEEAKMNELARNIQYALQNNNLQQAQDLTDAFNQSQQYIYDVEDALAQTKYQFALESQKLEDAASSISAAGLSQEFLATGRPTTQEDMAFIVKNPEGSNAYTKLLGTGQTSGSGNQNKALTMVNNILGGNTAGISGAIRTGNIPVLGQLTGSATSQADYDGLKSLLSLAERGQLKGTGAVSDFEARMLEKAAMAGLNQNLPTEEFERRLRLLKADLESGGAYDSTQADPQLMSLLGY